MTLMWLTTHQRHHIYFLSLLARCCSPSRHPLYSSYFSYYTGRTCQKYWLFLGAFQISFFFHDIMTITWLTTLPRNHIYFIFPPAKMLFISKTPSLFFIFITQEQRQDLGVIDLAARLQGHRIRTTQHLWQSLKTTRRLAAALLKHYDQEETS